jgi:hypothetical protein
LDTPSTTPSSSSREPKTIIKANPLRRPVHTGLERFAAARWARGQAIIAAADAEYKTARQPPAAPPRA